MLTKIVKYGSVAVVLLASLSWHSGTNGQLLLDLALCMIAVVMVQQAVRARQYFWVSGIVGTFLLLNPVAPALTPAGNLMLLLFLVGLSPFLITFAALMDVTATLHPAVIIEPPSQRTLPIPAGAWAVA